MFSYPVTLTKDDNGTFLVTCNDLPEVTTFGETEAECLQNARYAIEEALASRVSDRESIPTPSKGRVTVPLGAQVATKILLYQAMLEQNVSKNELSRRLKWHRPQVDRLLNLRHGTRLDAMEAAFGALGQRLDIVTRDQRTT